MMWRAIVVLAVHMATALLIWSGYSWIFEGMGLHPYISFTAAIALYSATWYWLIKEANDADVEITCYLEYLDLKEQLHLEMLNNAGEPRPDIEGKLFQVRSSRRYWEHVGE